MRTGPLYNGVELEMFCWAAQLIVDNKLSYWRAMSFLSLEFNRTRPGVRSHLQRIIKRYQKAHRSIVNKSLDRGHRPKP